MKNRVAQRGERIGCRDWHPDRAGRDKRYAFAQRRGNLRLDVGMVQ